MTAEQHHLAHERLHKLLELDATTKISFSLVELRGGDRVEGRNDPECDRDGRIEISQC